MLDEGAVAAEVRRRSAGRSRDGGRPRAAATAASARVRGRSSGGIPPLGSEARAGFSPFSLPCRAGHRARSGRPAGSPAGRSRDHRRADCPRPESRSLPSPSPGAELAGVAAFGIVRAADEGAELAKLERQVAGPCRSGRSRTGAPSSPAGKICGASRSLSASSTSPMRRSWMLAERHREVAPEIAQHLLPVDLAGRDPVELLLEIGGEVIFDIAARRRIRERR